MVPPRPAPRLYLITPPLGDPASFGRALAAALDAGDVAAVLLRLADSDERTLVNRAKAIATVVQPRDIALLVDGRADIAIRAGADGAHLTGIAALTAALGALKPDRIAGSGGLRSRHDAMLAAEAGADYAMFGEPDHSGGQAGTKATARPSTPCWSGSPGGRNCSSRLASATPQTSTRSARWRKRAPISSRWVIGYGQMHPPLRSWPPSTDSPSRFRASAMMGKQRGIK